MCRMTDSKTCEPQTAMASDDKVALADATDAAPDGWVFSSSLSPERLAEIRALIASEPAAGDGAAATQHAAAADAAFARLVAAHPNATIVGEARDSSAPPPTPLSSGGWTFSPELSATQLDEIRGLIAMNGLTPPPPPTAEDDADAAAGTADAPVPDADDDGAAEAAFAALVDAHPGAREIAPGIFACDS